MTIVNKSFLRANNCTFDTVSGLFLYVSGSSFQMNGNSTVRSITNDDDGQPLITIDSSTVTIADTTFTKLKSIKVSPLFNLQETTLTSSKVTFREFDKTLFSLEGGRYTFDELSIAQG
jgi:hypothetical protein